MVRWSRRRFAGAVAGVMVGCVRQSPSSVVNCPGPGFCIAGPHGAQVTAPAGAWSMAEPLVLELPTVGSTPSLPNGVVSVGATYALRPAGARFATEVTLAIPFDRTQVPPHARVSLLARPATADRWQEIPGALLHGASMVAPIRETASFVVVVPLHPLS